LLCGSFLPELRFLRADCGVVLFDLYMGIHRSGRLTGAQ
jgi:hypothetical protein